MIFYTGPKFTKLDKNIWKKKIMKKKKSEIKTENLKEMPSLL